MRRHEPSQHAPRVLAAPDQATKSLCPPCKRARISSVSRSRAIRDPLPSPQPDVSVASTRCEPFHLRQPLSCSLCLPVEGSERPNADRRGPGDRGDAERVSGEERGIPSAVVCSDHRSQRCSRRAEFDRRLTVESENRDLAIRAGASENRSELMRCPCDSVDCGTGSRKQH